MVLCQRVNLLQQQQSREEQRVWQQYWRLPLEQQRINALLLKTKETWKHVFFSTRQGKDGRDSAGAGALNNGNLSYLRTYSI